MKRSRSRDRGVFAVVAVLSAQAAYLPRFGWLHPWDDEGFLMLSTRQLLDGRRLYDEVRIWFGPVYFGWKLLLHGVLRLPLTHDVVRLTALATCLATSALSAGLALRLTGNRALAVRCLPSFRSRTTRVFSGRRTSRPSRPCSRDPRGHAW